MAPLECPICYSGGSRWFSICDNGHWICGDCIGHLIGVVYRSVSTIGDAVAVAAPAVKCPLCRQCTNSRVTLRNGSVVGTGRVANCQFGIGDLWFKCVFCGRDYDHELTARRVFTVPCDCRFCFECGFETECREPARERQSPRLLAKRLAELGLTESDVHKFHSLAANFYVLLGVGSD